MSQRIDEIKRSIRQARDHAYLGRYQEARKGFKKALDVVEEAVMMNTVDRRHIEDWKKFQATILQQKRLVDSIISMLNGITLENKDRNFGLGDSWGDFEQSRSTKYKFYEGQKRGNSNMRQTKHNNQDPEVWGPPPPKAEFPKPNNTIRNPSMQKRPPVNIQKTTNPNTTNANKGYDKPWLNNLGAKKSGKLVKADDEKKSFLLDRYPDGNGPDSHLIQMLEREVIDNNLNITFNDIAQLDTAKGLLQEAVLLPLKMPQYFTGIRRAWKGVLMFGPPGTGKTLLAKAIASSGKTTFFNVSASSLASKWKGQSQKLVRILFEMARFYAPTTLFFDQIDALGGRRSDGEDQSTRKVKTQLLVQMDGATGGGDEEEKKYVMVLAATNRPWDLDEALRRRLQKRIYIPLPNQKGRLQVLKINLKDLKLAQDVNLQQIVQKTKGFSGADLTNVCREAAYMPMRKKLKQGGGFGNIDNMTNFYEEVSVPLTMDDFKQALKNVNKSVGDQDLHNYEKWMKEFGSA